MGAVIRVPPVPLIETRDVAAIELSHLESGLLPGLYLDPGICFRPLEGNESVTKSVSEIQ